jgi:hypothetical protein
MLSGNQMLAEIRKLFKEKRVPKEVQNKLLSVVNTYEDVVALYKYIKKGYFKKNPAYSERQRLFMCAELGRKRSGKRTITKMTERQLSDYCKKNPAKVISHTKALQLTKRIISYAKKLFKHEIEGVKEYENPGESYHMSKFMYYMRELEKWKVGSNPYISTLAKAYEHLQDAEKSKELACR